MSARIVSSRTEAEVALSDAYGAMKAKLPGGEAIRHLRDDAFGIFAAAGLPHRRVEAWHYTDLRSLMREALPVAAVPDTSALGAINAELAGRPSFGGGRLVIVDGTFQPSLSDPLPDGTRVRAAVLRSTCAVASSRTRIDGRCNRARAMHTSCC